MCLVLTSRCVNYKKTISAACNRKIHITIVKLRMKYYQQNTTNDSDDG